MNLTSIKPGEVGKIQKLNSQGAIRRRLMDMGLLPGVKLSLERFAPTGDPVWIRFRGTQLALRRVEAEAIELQPLEA